MSIAAIAAAIDAQLGGSFAPPYTKSDIQTRVATALYNSLGFYTTNWVAFTPTGSWTTNTTYTGAWRRVGDSIQQRVTVAFSGAPDAGNLTVNLVSGLAFDTTKLVSANPATTPVSSIGNLLQSPGFAQIFALYQSTTSVVAVYNSTTTAMATVTKTAPYTLAAGGAIYLEFSAPISGWGI